MKRFLTTVGLALLLAALALPIPFARPVEAASAQTYTVMVGAENTHEGLSITAFFPSTVTIHAGDTVHWQLNTHEIHTVSFGYEQGAQLPEAIVPTTPPPSPAMINPLLSDQVPFGGGDYAGGLANSGLMGPDEGEVQSFDLTFPDVGSFLYVCLIHGWMMTGMVQVVAPDVAIPSPLQSMAMGRQEMAAALAQVPAALRDANASIVPPVHNPDGSTTYTIMLGYMEGQVMFARFFPDKVVVRPGDTVVWAMPAFNIAPHTVTFPNGAPLPSLFIPVPQQDQLPLLYVNLEVLAPAKLGEPLTRDGFYNSGVLFPIPGPAYSLTIGEMAVGPEPFRCLIHDDSGMLGTLYVLPR